MARRKRKDEEPEWTPPEFDEVGYMRKEIESAQIALVIIAWSAVGAGIAYLLYVFVHPAVGFILGVAAFAPLYFLLPILNLPVAGFKRRDWFGHASIYFFCWLAFFILLLNPPFGDHTPPTIQFVAVGSYATPSLGDPAVGSIFCWPPAGSVTVPMRFNGTNNNTLYLLFRATDNVAVRDVHVQAAQPVATNVTPAFVAGNANACRNAPSGSTYPPGSYAVKVSVTGSAVAFTVTATDEAGLSAAAAMTALTG